MSSYRALRYLAPNLITAANLTFGMVAMVSAHEGHFALAGWMIIWAVLCDRLDGLVARLLHSTSDLGVQLDSFADFLNFGLAPAFVMYSFLGGNPKLPFQHGLAQLGLAVACLIWVMAAVFRLARYNITTDDQVPTKIFFGIPTTLAGGLLIIWFLAFLKYAPGEAFGGGRVFGGLVTPTRVWEAMPIAMLIGAYLMASSLRMPKLVKAPSRTATILMMTLVVAGYIGGFARMYPELLVIPPTTWIVVFLVWGQLSETAKNLRPPPIFPPAKTEGPDGAQNRKEV